MSEVNTVLVLMAHPDDAEILCGGTMIRLSQLGWHVHIATAANGDCGSAELGRDEVTAVRHLEAQEAVAKIGGAYHCLGISDVKSLIHKRTSARWSICFVR